MRLVVLLLLVATPAAAAPCGDPTRRIVAVGALTQIALDPTHNDHGFAVYLESCFAEVVKGEREELNNACRLILARDPKHIVCIVGVVAQKGPESFELLQGLEQGPWDSPGFTEGGSERVLEMYTAIRDRRAVSVVIETWKASIDEAERRGQEPGWRGKHAMLVWRKWRLAAAKLLGTVGDADTRAFLAVQETTPDRGVARACSDAIRAIAAREKKTN